MGARSAGAEGGSEDLYEVLGVPTSATQAEIRAAFRKLAAAYHPDRNPDDPRAAIYFKRINAAYQVLADPSRRVQYDVLAEAMALEGEELFAPPDTPPPSGTVASKTEGARSSSASPPPSSPFPSASLEQEILSDGVRVTDRRIVLPDGQQHWFRGLTGAELVRHDRNHFLLPAALGGSGVALFLAPGRDAAWLWVALVGFAILVVRYLLFVPKYVVRLTMVKGWPVDAVTSPSASWAADVVRLVSEGVRRWNPRDYRGQLPPSSKVSVLLRLVEAVGGCIVITSVCVIVGALSDPNEGRSETAPSLSASAPAPVAWHETELGDLVVALPGPPKVATRRATIAGDLVDLQERTVDMNHARFLVASIELSSGRSWSPTDALEGIVTSAIADLRGRPGVTELAVGEDVSSAAAGAPERRVRGSLSRAGANGVPERAIVRIQAIALGRSGARLVLAVAPSGSEELVETMFASVRILVDAAAAAAAAPDAARAAPKAAARPRTWHCADGTLAYGAREEACDPHGGVDPTAALPTDLSAPP